MGQVFRVRNLISDRREAMKIVLPPREGAQNMPERFLREIRVLASLDHPHIVLCTPLCARATRSP